MLKLNKKIHYLIVLLSEVGKVGLEKVVEQYQRGNKEVFDKIYAETYGLVRFAIYQKIQNKYIIEDLIQDTYMKVCQMIPAYSSHNFQAWIYTIAKNIALDYIKKKKEILVEQEACDFVDKDTHPYLYFALRHLDEIEREVFLLKVLCGHTTKKISLIMNISPSDVNQTFYHARKKLQESLEVER